MAPPCAGERVSADSDCRPAQEEREPPASVLTCLRDVEGLVLTHERVAGAGPVTGPRFPAALTRLSRAVPLLLRGKTHVPLAL